MSFPNLSAESHDVFIGNPVLINNKILELNYRAGMTEKILGVKMGDIKGFIKYKKVISKKKL